MYLNGLQLKKIRTRNLINALFDELNINVPKLSFIKSSDRIVNEIIKRNPLITSSTLARAGMFLTLKLHYNKLNKEIIDKITMFNGERNERWINIVYSFYPYIDFGGQHE